MNTICAAHEVTSPSYTSTRHVLLLGGYSDSTRLKYLQAVTHFAKWCQQLSITPKSPKQLDRALSQYMVDLWFQGKSKVDASCTLFGIDMLVPGIKVHLVMSRRSLKGYTRLKPSTPYPPLPHTAVAAMAIWIAGQSKCRYHLQMAVGLLLSFDCYLRTSELLGLRYEDIAFGDDPRLGLSETQEGRIHIHLRHTKTGPHKGVEVRHPQIKHLLRVFHSLHEPGSSLFPWSRSTHLRWFHRACTGLGLSNSYVHHSLRHGGATKDYLEGMPIADVMVRGRWAHTKSATHYIQQGRQLMMQMTIPPKVDLLGRLAWKNLLFTIALSLSQHTQVVLGYNIDEWL